MGETQKIILVEDDRYFRESLKEYLQLDGYDIRAVGSAREFYQELTTHCFAVAILDIGLPDEDGLTLARHLRATSRCGVIILSARSMVDDRISGYQSGADTYMIKPVDCRELTAAIDSLLQRPYPVTLTSNAWHFDPDQWLLTSPSQVAVNLTGMELKLMRRLVIKPGETVERSELLMSIYGRDDEHAGRALEALIRRLRQKIIKTCSEPSPIKTFHGVGYSFSSPLTDSSQ